MHDRAITDHPKAGLLIALVTALTILSFEGQCASRKGRYASGYEASLAKVAAHCPKTYPKRVVLMPEGGALEKKSEQELLDMLNTWNPALQAAVAGELARRGDKVVPLLKRALVSEDWRVRSAAAGAFGSIIQHQTRNWRDYFPETGGHVKRRDQVFQKFSYLSRPLQKMLKDERLAVRMNSLNAAREAHLIGVDRDVALAVLTMAGNDPSDHLAEQALRAFNNSGGWAKLPPSVVLDGLSRAVSNPLPRGKADLMSMVKRLKEADQRTFIPSMLKLLEAKPERDMMFAGGGQGEAVRLLATFQVKELLLMLPNLMRRHFHGGGLLDECLKASKAFGPDAKVILPGVRSYLAELEEEKKVRQQYKKPSRREVEVRKIQSTIDKIKKEIEYLETL